MTEGFSAADAVDVDGLFAEYRRLRVQAERDRREAGHGPEVLATIRGVVAGSVEGLLGSVAGESSGYSRERVEAKLLGLVGLLRERFPEFVSPAELAATEQFIEMAFACYEHDGASVSVDSFAFLVSLRTSAATAEYGNELVPVVPALHYVPPGLRAMMVMGVPPYVMDTYSVDGMRGYLVCCAVYADAAVGVSRHEFVRSTRREVQRGADFATGRLGARVLGLGGLLPSLTRYGRTLNTPGAVVTTGHAGTISMVLSYLKRAVDGAAGLGAGAAGSGRSIGVLGLGSIGRSIAAAVAASLDCPVVVFDVDARSCRQFVSSLGDPSRVPVVGSTAELIERSDVVVSAVTTRVGVDAVVRPGSGAGREPLAGKLIIDDSQPFAFSPGLVRELGGDLAWVIGRAGPGFRRSWYDYATMADRHADVFGCEAEVSVLAAEYRALVAGGATSGRAFERVAGYAVDGPATLDQVAMIGELFGAHGVTVAPHQAFASQEWSAEPSDVIDLRRRPVSDRASEAQRAASET